MIVLERYILRRMLVYFISASIAALGIVWTVEALTKINVVTDSGQSIGTFLKLAFYVLPTVIPIVLPFSALLAITLTLTTMNIDSEMPVIAATGASRRVIFRPALILAALATLIVLVVTNSLEPYSRKVVREIVASANADLLTLVIEENTFKKVHDGVYVEIAGRGAGGQLKGIFVSDSRDPGIDLIYYAKSGVVLKNTNANLLLMSDGEVHRRNTKDGNLSIIRFTSYAFDLSAFAPAANGVFLMAYDQSTAYLLNPDHNDPLYKQSPQIFRAAFHKRLTQSFYPLVFALIGLSLAGGARSHRDIRLNPTMLAMGLAFGVRWLGVTFEEMGYDHAYGDVALYSLLLLAALIAISTIYRQRTLRGYIAKTEQGAATFLQTTGPLQPLFQLTSRLRATFGKIGS